MVKERAPFRFYLLKQIISKCPRTSAAAKRGEEDSHVRSGEQRQERRRTLEYLKAARSHLMMTITF